MPESTVHAILSAVEALDPAACGAFVVEIDERVVGTVFVERNQVCWAAFTGLHSRLRDILREQLTKEQVQAEAMRRALQQHTIESLLSLPQSQGEHVEWVNHRYQGYHPRFTFSPAELLVDVNAFLYTAESAGIDRTLPAQDLYARGGSFVPSDDGDLLPVRVLGESPTISELDELGAWAGAAFGVTRGFSPEVLRSALEAATDNVFVAWQTSRLHTHAAVVERTPALEQLVANLERMSYPIVLSRRACRSSRTSIPERVEIT